MKHVHLKECAIAALILSCCVLCAFAENSSSPALMCPAPLAGQVAGQPACGLGSKWNVVAGCWPGVYIRRGSSNVFDAQMTQVNGDRYAAVVVVSINGSQVSATQTDLNGGPCYLRNGTLDASGRTVTGTYECHPPGQPVVNGCFIGAIQCDGAPPSPGPAPALPLASGHVFSCEARSDGKRWACQIRFTSFDPASHRISGDVTWLGLGSVHVIEGSFSGDRLTFTETRAIRSGGAHLNVSYDMRVDGNAANGSYFDNNDKSHGTMTIDLSH